MSAPDEIDPAKAWLFAEKLLDEEDDRLAAMSDDQIERELAEEPDPPHVPTVAELIQHGERRARERAEAAEHASFVSRRAPAKRASWVVVSASVALGVIAIALVAERREVSAWFHHEPAEPLIGPDVASGPTPEQRAAKIRDEAYVACDDVRWVLCIQKLDAAKQLDPAGDSAPRVQAARKAAYDSTHTNPLEKGK